jgi:hypothetical protein
MSIVLDSGNSQNVSTLSSVCNNMFKTVERLVQVQERWIEVQKQHIEVICKVSECLIWCISANRSTGQSGVGRLLFEILLLDMVILLESNLLIIPSPYLSANLTKSKKILLFRPHLIFSLILGGNTIEWTWQFSYASGQFNSMCCMCCFSQWQRESF